MAVARGAEALSFGEGWERVERTLMESSTPQGYQIYHLRLNYPQLMARSEIFSKLPINNWNLLFFNTNILKDSNKFKKQNEKARNLGCEFLALF
jgi:hypothetical protein